MLHFALLIRSTVDCARHHATWTTRLRWTYRLAFIREFSIRTFWQPMAVLLTSPRQHREYSFGESTAFFHARRPSRSRGSPLWITARWLCSRSLQLSPLQPSRAGELVKHLNCMLGRSRRKRPSHCAHSMGVEAYLVATAGGCTDCVPWSGIPDVGAWARYLCLYLDTTRAGLRRLCFYGVPKDMGLGRPLPASPRVTDEIVDDVSPHRLWTMP